MEDIISQFALMKANNSITLELLSSLISELDSCLVGARELHKELGLTMKQRKRSREYLTVLGWLRFDRSYCQEKETGEYVYSIDKVIGISDYERISPGVSAALVNGAAEV